MAESESGLPACVLRLLNFGFCRFGNSGFLVLWALNFVGMLAVGLALEAMFTILTHRFMPYFMITWIIGGSHVCVDGPKLTGRLSSQCFCQLPTD